LLGVLLVVAQPLAAQQAGMLVLESPAGVETMAYGNAPNLFTSSPTLLFEAPALLQRAQGVAASFERYGGAGTLASLAGAGEFQGGGFAFGAQYMRYGLDAGFPDMRDIQGVALTDGSTGVTEFVGSVGYARTLFGIRAGAVLKYAEQSANAARSGKAAFDFGLARGVGPVMLSLSGRNFGQNLLLSPGPEGPQAVELEMPQQLIAGATSDDFEVGPLDMFLTTQVTRRRDGEYIPAGGLELSYWPVNGYTFRLRGGLQRVPDDARSPVTFGAAFTGDNITIEYAFQSFDGQGNAHRIGLRWQ
jgi:hypothetical protein